MSRDCVMVVDRFLVGVLPSSKRLPTWRNHLPQLPRLAFNRIGGRGRRQQLLEVVPFDVQCCYLIQSARLEKQAESLHFRALVLLFLVHYRSLGVNFLLSSSNFVDQSLKVLLLVNTFLEPM